MPARVLLRYEVRAREADERAQARNRRPVGQVGQQALDERARLGAGLGPQQGVARAQVAGEVQLVRRVQDVTTPARSPRSRRHGRAAASSSRAMMSFWISLVPSYRRYSRESRYIRSTTVELM